MIDDLSTTTICLLGMTCFKFLKCRDENIWLCLGQAKSGRINPKLCSLLCDNLISNGQINQTFSEFVHYFFVCVLYSVIKS